MAHANHTDVVILGAGLAGLCCARTLQESGINFSILEASDGVGGRVRTDQVDGFLLDRGFQVLLTAYPEAQAVLDYPALELKPFYPGALVRYQSRFHQVADPWRKPLDGLVNIAAPIGNLKDKFRVGLLRRRLVATPLEQIFQAPEAPTIDALRAGGFSDGMIGRFFRPFLGGILLDRELQASSRMFEFIFRSLSLGDISLPGRGMQAIPDQLASALPRDSIRTAARAERVDGNTVTLESGERINARAVVVATEGPEAARLIDGLTAPCSRSVTCLYFAAAEPPIEAPLLVLNGESSGLVDHLCVPSNLAPGYAPPGRALVSATIIGMPSQDDAALEAQVRGQLADWFGSAVKDWQHLRTYRVPHAQPDQMPPALEPPERPVRMENGLFVCGDHRDHASLQGAMVSGRRAAEAVRVYLS